MNSSRSPAIKKQDDFAVIHVQTSNFIALNKKNEAAEAKALDVAKEVGRIELLADSDGWRSFAVKLARPSAASDNVFVDKMHQSEQFVVALFLVTTATSVRGLDLTSPSRNLSTPDVSTSTAVATSRRSLVRCEITLSTGDERPEMRPATAAKRLIATPTNTSGSGCDDPDAVTSLTLIAANGADLLAVDQLPVCRFSSVERVTVVGRLLNKSPTSLNCFRNIRHLILKRADIGVIQPSLIYDSFRSRDFRSVDVSDSGVDELASEVFDGRRMSCLEDVNLSMNNLTKITNATFVNLASLKTLNLSHNAITYIAPHAFANTNIRCRLYINNANLSYSMNLMTSPTFFRQWILNIHKLGEQSMFPRLHIHLHDWW